MSLVAHNRTGEPVLALRSPPPLRELFRAARIILDLGARCATQSHDAHVVFWVAGAQVSCWPAMPTFKKKKNPRQQHAVNARWHPPTGISPAHAHAPRSAAHTFHAHTSCSHSTLHAHAALMPRASHSRCTHASRLTPHAHTMHAACTRLKGCRKVGR